MIKRIFKIMFSEDSIIPWMIFVSIIPMILVSIVSYNIAKGFFQADIESTLMISLQKKIEIINNYISERKLDVLQISGLPEVVEAVQGAASGTGIIDKNKISDLTDYLTAFARNIGIENMYFVNPDGKIIYALANEQLLGENLTESLKNKDLYKVFFGAKMLRMPFLFAYYDPHKTPSTGVYIANPILDEGRTVAVLIAQLNADVIQSVVVSYLGYGKILEKTYLGTVLDNNTVIFMQHQGVSQPTMGKNIDPKLLNLVDDAIKGNLGRPKNITINGEPYLVVYDYDPQLNMGMLLQYNKNEIYKNVRWLKLQMIFTILISLILVFITVFLIARKLWQANVKSERLLENILPGFVIDELKEKKQFLPRKVMATSVLFCDIVNFTPFASKTSAEEVVKVLDDFFSAFDQLASEFGMEKIKTIGDAYMAVAGLIVPEANHANRAVDMGLAMIKAVKHYNLDHGTDFALRVGIDSGEVTTGIIGRQKFSYDLWGNAVNRASRMESTGLPDKVQISATTFAALQNKDQYTITLRTEVMVKGLGKMDTYLVTARK